MQKYLPNSVLQEIEVLLEASKNHMPPHPSVVSQSQVHYGCVTVPLTGASGSLFFVVSSDLCEGGELYNYLVFNGGIRKFDEPIARKVFKQLCEGLAHMHSNKIFHRDLKLENVVLDSHYNAKIMDFGLAKHASGCVYYFYIST